jgi:hypothetical protein
VINKSAPAAREEAAERFKRLLNAPPVIEQLVYSRALPEAGRVAVSAENPIAGSRNVEFYELRWQTNGMFCRQLLAPEQARDNDVRGECFSLWNDRFCFLDALTRPSVYVIERDKLARGIYPDAYHAAHIRMTDALLPLTFGISHIYPGQLRWEGDSFTGCSMADKKPIWIRGRISGFTNAVPNELRVQYSNDMGHAEYRVQYDYAAEAPAGYPSRISNYLVGGNKELLYSVLTVLSIRTTNRSLAESHFRPSAELGPGKPSWLYLTNDAIYSSLPSGGLIEAQVSRPSFRLSGRECYKNRYYYLGAALWTVALFALGLRASSKPKATKESSPQHE